MDRKHNSAIPRVGALEAAADVKREAGKLYRAARRGEIAAADASRLASMLALILKVIEGADLEARIATLEQTQTPASPGVRRAA
jgi:hypothetical protein